MTDDFDAYKGLLLSVHFDVNQRHSNLDWSLVDKINDQRRNPDTGQHAGAVRFAQGEKVKLEINATGPLDKMGKDPTAFSGFQIVQCCLVTRPLIVRCQPDGPVRYAPPSPFVQSLGASYIFPNDFSVGTAEADQSFSVTQTWKHELDIGTQFGNWELSLNLTVRILRGQDDPIEIRVFQFDPEVQVGDGSRLGTPRSV